jgi:titin
MLGKLGRAALVAALVATTIAVGAMTGTAAAASPPGEPTAVAATPGNRSARVSWQAPSSDGGSPITGYRLYWDGAQLGTPLAATTHSITRSQLVNGRTYQARVAAENASGEGASVTVTVTPQPLPSEPTSVSAIGGSRAALLSWQPPTSDGGSSIIGYRLFLEGVAWGDLLSASERSGFITGLTNGSTYLVAVAAVTALGDGDQASVSVSPSTVPEAPTSFSATAGDGVVTMAWSPPASNGGRSVSGYRIYVDGVQRGGNLATTARSVVVDGLTNGIAHDFQVAAVNTNGAGAKTEALRRTPEGPPTSQVPGLPTITSVTPGIGQATVVWEAPASDGGSAVTAYRVFVDGEQRGDDLPATARSLLVDGLVNNSTHAFQVAAVNVHGEGGKSAAVVATAAIPPSAPTSFTAAPQGTGVIVRWQPPSSDGGAPITAYRVFRDGVQVGADRSPSLREVLLTGMSVGTTYEFQVAAINVRGEGTRTDAIVAAPATAPRAPTSFRATPGDEQVTLAWQPPSADGGAAVTGYRVFVDGLAWGDDLAADATGAVVDGLANGVERSFEVAAFNAAGTGPRTDPLRVRPAIPTLVPGVPTSVTATTAPGSRQIVVQWEQPTSNGGSTVTGYRVYLDGVQQGGTQHQSVRSYTLSNLTYGTAYQVEVAAVNANGVGPRSAPVVAMPHSVPGQPTSFAATAGDRQVSLSWQPPASNGGSAITGYRVLLDGVAWGDDPSADARSVVVDGLTNGSGYSLRVAALNAAGQGTPTPAASRTPSTVPGVPTSFSATAGDAQVTLAWQPPASNGGSAITGYRVLRDGVQLGSTRSAATREVVLTGLANGTAYDFQVVAVNANGEGARTDVLTRTPATVPGVPTSFSAISGDAQVTVAWQPPSSNGGSGITGYRVYVDGVQRGADLTSTARTLVVDGLANGTSYGFQVSAVNAQGESSRTTTISRTPALPPPAASFRDVPADHPFFAEVGWAVAQGITNGYADGTFRPGGGVTRQSMAAFLHRLAGAPDVSIGQPTFRDVRHAHPFLEEIEWAVDAGVTTGYSDGTYRPSAPVTRQSMVAFVHRMAGEPDVDLPIRPSFRDVGTGNPFYEQVEWASAEGITGGYPDGTFRPAAGVSRAATAAFLKRLVEGPGVDL